MIDSTNDKGSQIMSFGESKSIASKTTERASKNTGTTSGGFTNQFTFSKQSRRIIYGGPGNQNTALSGAGTS